MSTPFGPQLIGETEKTLDALLHRFLQRTGLTERQWVTLRLAGMLDGSVDADGLATALADRAHFSDAGDLVAELTDRGLLADGRLSAAGRELTTTLQTTITADTAPIWDNLPSDDVAAATRVLNEVITRARVLLG
jgi:hypothetical protein